IGAMRCSKEFAGLTAKEIETGFRVLSGKFLHSQFHTTYIDRRLGPRSFLEFAQGRYRFRKQLLDNLSLHDLERLHEELIGSLRDAAEQRRAAIGRLETACGLPEEQIAERRELVEEYLARFRGNRGRTLKSSPSRYFGS